MRNLWNRLFLVERSSFSLSLFRVAVALTTIFHVFPTLCHLADNYYQATSFRTYNANFFPLEFLEWIVKSPDWVTNIVVVCFLVFSFFLLIGFLSLFSCVITVLCCYYFYAINAMHVGTLSWDILLVTLFLMCLTPYHGDYFSVDCLIWGNENSYRRERPYFMQRLLQLQIGFTFFYTALYKVTVEGNWFTQNPIYSLMNSPPHGVVKFFILKDYLADKPEICFWIGVSIAVTEFLLIFLLFWRKTRLTAISLGIVFQIILVLTLDVPAIFFFLFPSQLLLFINPDRIMKWIDQKRKNNISAVQSKIIYDGNCRFCLSSVKKLKTMDLYAAGTYVDFQQLNEEQISGLSPQLTKEKCLSQLYLIEPNGRLFGGFDVFRRICFVMPMLYPLILLFYFPGMGLIGPAVYKFIAKNRYLFHFNKTCQGNSCFR